MMKILGALLVPGALVGKHWTNGLKKELPISLIRIYVNLGLIAYFCLISVKHLIDLSNMLIKLIID